MFTSYSLLILAAGIISSNGHPIDPKVVLPVADGFGIVVLGTAFLVTTVVALIACSCCKQRRDGFKEFRNSPVSSHVGFTNVLSSELAIFPPPGSGSPPSQSPYLSSPVAPLDSSPPSRPAAFSAVIPSVSDWFTDPNANFPRQQLFYQKEIGNGWFGKVVKGEARGAKVVVRILREDATPEEKGYFLHEAKPFRDLRHKNISRLFARCLENDPFLLLFEFCSNGDLKSFLVTNSGSRNAITEQKISLKMMLDVTEGLKFMNEHGFIHTDIAARNCLVTSDLTVKIGDYGTSIEKYKMEYYIVGDVAVPIRWCAPETLTCTATTIESKEVTEAGNVWSLAVLLWEIAEFGKLPYTDLSDEQVILRVFGEEKLRLPQPTCAFGQYLHNIMSLCWRSENRASIEQVLSMLIYLKNNPFQESDFEARWKMLKPNTVAVVDNHTPIHSPRHTELAQRPRLPAKLEFDSGVDLEIKPTDENPDSCRTSTPNTISPQLSVTSEEMFQPVQHKSPSLTNLKGSLEDVTQFDSWLMGVEQKTEEDRKFVKNISEAIKNLDETLALEKTSSSSQDSSMEGCKKPLLDFKLGPIEGERKGDSSSSDTEEETWRNRIERGEFTEKVKEKSKSVTDLMVLTHIDSEGSESDSLPSLTRQYSLKKNVVKGVSYTGVGFGSEGNIRNAVLGEELQEKLKQLTLWKTDDQSFLVKGASETTRKKRNVPPNNSNRDIKLVKELNVYSEEKEIRDPPSVNNYTGSVNSASVMNEVVLESVNTQCTDRNNCLETTITVPEVEREIKTEEPCVQNSNLSDLVNSNVQLDSSHSSDNSVPKIVITESELAEGIEELESDVDTQYLVDIVPRKFVFVCRDLDEHNVETDKQIEDSPAFNFNANLSSEPSPSSDESALQSNSTVILGSCEEHTLEYFKGLKTTFMPAEEIYDSDYTETTDIELMVDEDITDNTKNTDTELMIDEDISESTIPLDEKPSDTDKNEISNKFSCSEIKEYPLPDLVPENTVNKFKSSIITSEIENKPINGIIKKSLDDIVETKHFLEKEVNEKFLDDNSLLINNSPTKDISDEFIHNDDFEYSNLVNDDKVCLEKSNIYSDRTINSNDSLSTDSPVAGKNLNSCSSSNSSDTESHSPSVNSSEEQLVEAPYPFNQPLSSEHHVGMSSLKSKSLDSFLIPKNDLDEIASLKNGIYLDNNVNSVKHFVPVFNMTESISENTFISQRSCYDPYYSADSGHSSDRCMEQDKQMNDLKCRLEDVVKSGSDFQLKNSEEEYGGKLLTPDDERSSDSGFRDKGSLSESVEDTCDEKYNLEDIDAELEDFSLKPVDKDEYRYYEQLVNEPDQEGSDWFLTVRPDSSSKENGWLSQSTENEETPSLSIDAEFAAAIRNELKEKLPCAQQGDKSDDDNSPEPEEQELNTDSATQFAYPSQLSPIMEEQESNQSSLQLNDSSPILILPPPDSKTDSFKEDIVRAFESLDSSSKGVVVEDLDGDNVVIFNDDKIIIDDDVLIVDTETNEATLIESPKPQSHLAFVIPVNDSHHVINEDCSPETNSENYILTPNAPLTPNSVETESHSSPENANMSGLFLSPCSIRSDLFDSGPPSLPFDLGQSLEEVEDLPVSKVASCENLTEQENFIENGDCVNKLVSNVPEVSFEENGGKSFITKIDVLIPSKTEIEVQDSQIDTDRKNSTIVNLMDDDEGSHLIKTCALEPTNFIFESPMVEKCGTSQLHSDEKFKVSNELLYKNSSDSAVGHFELINPSEEAKHHFAQVQIENLIASSALPSESQSFACENISSKSAQENWLKELIFTPSISEEVKENNKNSSVCNGFHKKDWPTLDELIASDAAVEKTDKANCLKPNITSTLALLSPDLSSADSKSHSVLSSFSSTPTSEDSKTVCDVFEHEGKSAERISKPKSLSLKSDVGAPMPSPEDAEKGWRPTICQLMELTDQAAADGEEMTTSFIEPDENGTYTPDWESDISEEHSSSSSGEFVWKHDEMGPMMERIDEEDEDETSSSSDGDTSSESSSSAEFVPSTWNAMAVPLRPALRTSPAQKKNGNKRVVFKKEKYQCVYEYPREDSDSEDEEEDGPGMWQTPNTPVFDYSMFTDWELGDAEVPTPIDSIDSDSEEVKKPKKELEYDFYRLDYNLGSQLDRGWSENLPEDETEFSPLAADLTPVRLGDLKHTKATLRLELPQLRPDQGEASILDSGIDTA